MLLSDFGFHIVVKIKSLCKSGLSPYPSPFRIVVREFIPGSRISCCPMYIRRTVEKLEIIQAAFCSISERFGYKSSSEKTNANGLEGEG